MIQMMRSILLLTQKLPSGRGVPEEAAKTMFKRLQGLRRGGLHIGDNENGPAPRTEAQG